MLTHLQGLCIISSLVYPCTPFSLRQPASQPVCLFVCLSVCLTAERPTGSLFAGPSVDYRMSTSFSFVFMRSLVCLCVCVYVIPAPTVPVPSTPTRPLSHCALRTIVWRAVETVPGARIIPLRNKNARKCHSLAFARRLSQSVSESVSRVLSGARRGRLPSVAARR